MKKQSRTSHVWNADVMTDEQTHLPLSAEAVEAVLNNPQATFADCDALYFSLLNGDADLFCRYSDEVLERQAEIVSEQA